MGTEEAHQILVAVEDDLDVLVGCLQLHHRIHQDAAQDLDAPPLGVALVHHRADDHREQHRDYDRQHHVRLRPPGCGIHVPGWLAENNQSHNVLATGEQGCLGEMGDHPPGAVTSLVTTLLTGVLVAEVGDAAVVGGDDVQRLIDPDRAVPVLTQEVHLLPRDCSLDAIANDRDSSGHLLTRLVAERLLPAIVDGQVDLAAHQHEQIHVRTVDNSRSLLVASLGHLARRLVCDSQGPETLEFVADRLNALATGILLRIT